MEIPLERMLNLPEGASYDARSGRASVKLTLQRDTVYVSATCDSLLLMLEEYERWATDLHETVENRTETKNGGILQRSIWFVAGLVILMAEILVLTLLKRKK